MALTPQQLHQLNKSQAEQEIEQLKALYARLYPFIIRDFYHRLDLDKFLLELDIKLVGHVHPGVTSGPAATLIPGLPPSTIDDTLGKALVISSPIVVADAQASGLAGGVSDTGVSTAMSEERVPLDGRPDTPLVV